MHSDCGGLISILWNNVTIFTALCHSHKVIITYSCCKHCYPANLLIFDIFSAVGIAYLPFLRLTTDCFYNRSVART